MTVSAWSLVYPCDITPPSECPAMTILSPIKPRARRAVNVSLTFPGNVTGSGAPLMKSGIPTKILWPFAIP